MINNLIRFILILFMVFTSITAHASGGYEGLAVIILFMYVALPCLVIFLGFIITSTVFLIQHRSTSARQTYGKVAQILSILLIFPFPIIILLIYNDSIFRNITILLVACAIMVIPGALSAFLAHKVKNSSLENSKT
jgi:hypothetical protein